MLIDNMFADIPTALPEEMTQALLDHKNVRIERIVSHGQASPDGFWFDQDEHEWVLLLQGVAGLAFEGDAAERTLKPGDYILIPAHTRHRVAWTDPDAATIWLAIFFS